MGTQYVNIFSNYNISFDSNLALMNYFYMPTNFPQMPFYYWPCVEYEHFQPIVPEKAQENRETFTEEQSIKLQENFQNAKIQKVSTNLSSVKKASSQKKKIKKNKKRDTNFSTKTQKQNRNYASILSKTFLLYLAYHPKRHSLIDTISKQHNIFLTPQNFESQFHQMFDLKANYIRREKIQDVLSSKVCSEDFSLIFRILFQRFFKLQVFPAVFKSNKLTKKVKSKEAKFARKVYESFFQGRKLEINKKTNPIQQVKQSLLQNNQPSLKVEMTE